MADASTWTVFADSAKILGGIVAFGVALYQYRKGERWKTLEFVSLRLKEFEADDRIQAALTMLDWTDRPITMRSSKTGKSEQMFVDEATLQRSILPHSPAGGFTDAEASIRDCFDKMFDALGRMQAYIDTGAVHKEDLQPFIRYWMEMIAGNQRTQHMPDFYVLLHNYIDTYGFDDARRLLEGYDFKVAESSDELEAAIRRVNAIPKHSPPQPKSTLE